MQNPKTQLQELWFRDVLVRVLSSYADSADAIALLEFQAPPGAATPLHVHHTHDEVFHVLEGEATWRVGGSDVPCRAGDTLLAPKGVPHGYKVNSPDGARWLSVTTGPDFEGFVRALARPAEYSGLPERTGLPTDEEMQALVIAGRGNGIEIVGPPPYN